jgi:hypothetical protein
MRGCNGKLFCSRKYGSRRESVLATSLHERDDDLRKTSLISLVFLEDDAVKSRSQSPTDIQQKSTVLLLVDSMVSEDLVVQSLWGRHCAGHCVQVNPREDGSKRGSCAGFQWSSRKGTSGEREGEEKQLRFNLPFFASEETAKRP